MSNRMPDYAPSGRRQWKPIVDQADTTPRVGRVISVPAELVVKAIGLAVVCGWGISFSPTSDGGALGVHLYVGQQPYRSYASTADELEAILEAICDRAQASIEGAVKPARIQPLRASQGK